METIKKLLTGCAGFIGSNVMRRLGCFGVDNLSFGFKGNPYHAMGFEEIPQSTLDNYDVLIHCACANIIFGMKEPVKTFEVNALKTIELFRRFRGKIIYTSTASIYGNAEKIPTPENTPYSVSNAYDQSKLIAEMFLRQRGNYTTLRLSNVYGRNQRPENPYCGVIGKMLGQALNNEPMTVIDGSATRDFTYVEDVVDAIEAAAEQKPLNTEVNIATGKETSILELTGVISSLLDFDMVKYIPKRQIDSLTRRCLDISRAKMLLNWEPKYTLKEGLHKTIKWMKDGYFLPDVNMVEVER